MARLGHVVLPGSGKQRELGVTGVGELCTPEEASIRFLTTARVVTDQNNKLEYLSTERISRWEGLKFAQVEKTRGDSVERWMDDFRTHARGPAAGVIWLNL